MPKESGMRRSKRSITPETNMMTQKTQRNRLPAWFKGRLSAGNRYALVRDQVMRRNLYTVCQSAACPNQTECWNAGTATFMILGNICTRSCRFCNVPKGVPGGVDHDEPKRVGEAVASLNLTYAVVTSVTRDDLPDGGAGIFAETISVIREKSPGCRIEILIPDFLGSEEALLTIRSAAPDVLSHNLETVPSLYSSVRPGADYQRSLKLLERAKKYGLVTKTGLMLGLGESIDEVQEVIGNLQKVGCDILTLGQYLQPRRSHLSVIKYYHPEEFQNLSEKARKLGLRKVVAGPLVRSSYHAEEHGIQ